MPQELLQSAGEMGYEALALTDHNSVSGSMELAQAAKGSGGGVACNPRNRYGGSVKPENVKALMSEEEIDGALVGGASLDPKSFAAIVKY